MAGLVAGCGRAALVHAGVVVLAAAGSAAAQEGARDPDGRDFAGVRLPIPVVDGGIDFVAPKASVWSEAAEPGTRRLLLDGGVRVTLGDATFEARRAFVWMLNLRSIGAAGGEYQVYVVFEDVGSPAIAAVPIVAGRWLPV